MSMIINPYRFGGGGGGGGDPYWANVELLLHNDSSSFVDSSSSPATINTNSTTFDSSVKKWGAGSASHRSTNHIMEVTDDGRFGVTTADWTVEMWVAPDDVNGFITGRRLFDSQFCRLRASGTDDIIMEVSFDAFASFTTVATSAINMTLGEWYYVAARRSGSTFALYIDGTLIGSTTNANDHDGSTYNVNIGGVIGGSNQARCWLDDVRVTIGVARDVTVVPTAAFPDS